MTGPAPQDMRALAAQHESAAHREPFGANKCWHQSTAATFRDAAAEIERLRSVISTAPHQLDCSTQTHAGDCDCWKADPIG